MNLPVFYWDELIQRALSEDITYMDVTTDLLIPEGDVSSCYWVAKDTGILCGMEAASRVFQLLDGQVKIEPLKRDGDRVEKGDVLCRMKGQTKALLKGERTALNLAQHMSGIATATRRCVDLCAGTKASIADTRKTLPGLRAMQKYAVLMGGGRNHRFNLSDGAMLKDNHIDAFGGILPAVRALRAKAGHMVKIEVEVRDFRELEEALEAGAEVIMLDNMSCEDMAQAVKITAGRALLEASGNVTLDTIRDVAETGVDIISLGALTHSVQCFDISMKWDKKELQKA